MTKNILRKGIAHGTGLKVIKSNLPKTVKKKKENQQEAIPIDPLRKRFFEQTGMTYQDVNKVVRKLDMVKSGRIKFNS